MKQVLHIFHKDVRSRWMELLLVMVCLIAYGYHEISTWPGERASAFSSVTGNFLISTLLEYTTFLLPVSWILLLGRVVQDESLVGNRQFWITRPYEWKRLLFSKILFLVAFINGPLLCLQMYLLHRAGFSPSSYFLSLLPTHLGLLLAIVLPALALAVVTATLGQYLLAILAVVLSLIGIAVLNDKIPNSHFSGPSDNLEALTGLFVLIAVVLIQYAVRRTTFSRILLLGFMAFVALVVVVFPYGLVIRSKYPSQAPNLSQLTWTLNPPASSRTNYNDDPDMVEYQLPISTNGLSEAQVVQVDGYRVRLESSNGTQWESNWIASYSKLYNREANFAVSLRLKRVVAERLANGTTNMRISLLLSRYHTEGPRTFVVPSGQFRSPDLGICVGGSGYSRSLRCRIPVTARQNLIISSDLSKTTCSLRKDESIPAERTSAFAWVVSHPGFDPALSPVRVYNVNLWDFDRYQKTLREPGICPDTPLVFSVPQLEGRVQVQFSVDGVNLKSYEAQVVQFGLIH